jgi:hypothetical protein
MFKESMQSDDVRMYRPKTKGRGKRTGLAPFWYVAVDEKVLGLVFLDQTSVRYFGQINEQDRGYVEEHVSIMLEAEATGSVPPPPPEGLDSKEEEDYGDF